MEATWARLVLLATGGAAMAGEGAGGLESLGLWRQLLVQPIVGGGNAVSGQGRSHCLERGQRAIQIKKAFKKKAEKLFEPSLFRSALGGLCALGHAFVLFRIGRVPRLRDFFGLLGRVASSLNGIPDGAPR